MIEPRREFVRPAGGWPDGYLINREWLVSNGLGGYSSNTLAGINTRGYHGILTTAQPAPLGRLLMLKQVSELVDTGDGQPASLNDDAPSGNEPAEHVSAHLAAYRHELGLPVWHFALAGRVIEKRIVMPYRQNSVFVCYRLLGGNPVRLMLRPWVHFGSHDSPYRPDVASHYALKVQGDRYEISAEDFPVLRLTVPGVEPRFIVDGGARRDIFLRVEADRGYTPNRVTWSPGYFALDLKEGQQVALVASSEPWNAITALDAADTIAFEQERRRRLLGRADPRVVEEDLADLVLAADSFLMSPVGRVKDTIRAHATGDQVRSVIAGYHWFADWGRDTMISFEGLTLTTGRHTEAGWILRTYQHYVRDGLLPNFFPEGMEGGVYHTADATLWFFHALHRYVSTIGDRDTLRLLLPTLHDVVEHHVRGTRFGIGVDPADGLLRQGAEGYQLTWMDAKVDDWVVTPRRGKAVEINALWYNALRLLTEWNIEEEGGGRAEMLRGLAERNRDAFNRRFWNPATGHLFDVVDGEQGDDPLCRPNQLLSFSLTHPVLDRQHWEPVFETVRARLLTPVGLRSLAPGSEGYKARYFGDLRSRDAAYHQGTVWGWLVGPFVDAWLAVHPDDRAGARRFLEGMLPHLDDFGIGTIAEIFDAEEPYTARGCISQAWSVGEMLRCWAKTAPEVPVRSAMDHAVER